MMKALALVCCLWVVSVAMVDAATLRVLNTADSGPGSLRAAIADANATEEPDAISFEIPQSDSGYDPAAGVWTINVAAPLIVTKPLVIDGYTQPGAQPNTNPAGKGLNTELKIVLHFNIGTESGLTTYYFAWDCTIRGLVFNGTAGTLLALLNGPNTVEGNFFGTDAFGSESDAAGAAQSAAQTGLHASYGAQIGGQSPEQRNLFAGRTLLAINAFDSNTIEGNLFGTTVEGTAAQPLRSGISAVIRNQIGGGTAAASNVMICNGGDFTFTIYSYHDPFAGHSGNNTIEGNLIGTDISGHVALGAQSLGIFLSSNNNRVGGASAGEGNVIGGNAYGGIRIGGQDNSIIGNAIGSDVSRTKALPNGRYGIFLLGDFFRRAAGNRIGGTNAGEGNIIAFNHGAGIVMPSAGEASIGTGQATILENSIFGNDAAGIDFEEDGVSVNDDDDADFGPNNLQNHPILTSVDAAPAVLRVAGRLQSAPNQSFRLEFFANRAAGTPERRDGEIFIGTADVATDATGAAAFDVICTQPVNAATVTATATNTYGDTSEFSAPIAISSAPPQILNLSGRGYVGTADDEELLIGGLTVTGTSRKDVLLRAVGQSSSGEPERALIDPTLEVYDDAGKRIASNDNWQDTQPSEIRNTGLAPTNETDAAILLSLEHDRQYTAIVRGKHDDTGIGVLEAYDVGQNSSATLANISTRGFVNGGDEILIAGVITAAPARSAEVVVRAIAPSLHRAGLENTLADPTLELRNADGELILINDNWKDNAEQAARVAAAGLAPQDDHESAVAIGLPPGPSTAIVRGKGDERGVALVEVYRTN